MGGFLTLLTCGGCGSKLHQPLTRVGSTARRRFVCDDCLATGDWRGKRLPPNGLGFS
jgi:hypothetical protein